MFARSHKKSILKCSAWLLLLVLPLSAFAAPGDLDATFGGGDGWVSTGPSADEYFYLRGQVLAEQPNGKLLLAGNGYNFDLARYNADGTIDTNFGIDGMIPASTAGFFITSLARQSNGKLVVGGTGNYTDFSLARFNRDGTLDTTFGSEGRAVLGMGSPVNSEAGFVVMQQQVDGKFVMAGTRSNMEGNDDFVLVRFNKDGSLDVGFGVEGKVMTGRESLYGEIYYDEAYSLVQQSDGKLVVAGRTCQWSNCFENVERDIMLVRYNPDGSIDTTFGDQGFVVNSAGQTAGPSSVIQQSDGKIVVAANDAMMIRYNLDGSLDTSFNGSGILVMDNMRWVSAILQQKGGKLVVVGSVWNSDESYLWGSYDLAVLRYSVDGTPDQRFGIDGKKIIRLADNTSEWASSVIQQRDGKLVIAGLTRGEPTEHDMVIVRIDSHERKKQLQQRHY